MDGNFEAWRIVIRIESELAGRRAERRARLGIIPQPRRVARLWLAEALRRVAARLSEAPAAPIPPAQPVAHPRHIPGIRGPVPSRPVRAPLPRRGFGRCTARSFRFPRREGTRQ